MALLTKVILVYLKMNHSDYGRMKKRGLLFFSILLQILPVLSQDATPEVDSLLEYYDRVAWESRYNDSRKSSTYLHKMLKLSQKEDQGNWEAYAYRKLVSLKAFQGQEDSIRYYYDIGYDHITHIDTTALYSRLGKLHSEMGEAIHRIKNLDSSLVHYKKSDSLFKLDKDSLGILIAKINIGSIQHAQGNYKKAISSYIEGVPYIDTTSYQQLPASLYNGISQSYRQLYNYDKAISYSKKAIKLGLKQVEQYPEYLTPLLISISDLYLKNKNIPEAQRHLEIADSIITTYNVTASKIPLIQQKADILVETHKAREALTLLRSHEGLLDTYQLGQEIQFRYKYTIAQTEYQLGQFKNAQQTLEPLLRQATAENMFKEQGYLSDLLSKTYERQNNFKEALLMRNKAASVQDSLLNIESQKEFKKIEVAFNTAQKEKQLLFQRVQLAEKELDIRKKNNLVYGLTGSTVLLVLLGYLFYNQQRLKNRQQAKEFELKNALTTIETQNRLQEQRLRISRDLHDNIGSQLTFITSSLDNVKYTMKDSDLTKNKLTEIGDFTKTTINELRDTIWAMNKEAITLEDLEARLGNLLDQAGTAAPKTQFVLDFQKEIDSTHKLSSVEGMNLYRIIQEGVNNAIKYAEASEVSITLSRKLDKLNIEIKDNGKGFNTAQPILSNGLNNMKKRAKDISARYSITSQEAIGTTLIIEIAMT